MRARGDDQPRHSGAARLHDYHAGLVALQQGGPSAARGALGAGEGVPRPARDHQRIEVRRRGASASRLRPFGRARLHAGHDGDGPQPRPHRRDGARARRVDEERALRLGLLPPLRHDVLERGARHSPRRLRRRARRREDAPRRRDRPRDPRRRAPQADPDVQGHRERPHRCAVSPGSARAVAPGDRRRLRLVVRQEGDRVPPDPRHPRGLGDRRHGDGDGVRQSGRDVGDGGRLHARPADGRA